MKETVLITGASRGIGRETARLFALNGYRVVINYNKSEAKAFKLRDELTTLGCDCLTVCADVSNREQVSDMVMQIINKYKRIDVLVNNAGIAQQKLFTDITMDDWNRMFDVSVKGMFNCCQEVLPYMIHVKKGRIINISSIWGMVGASCEVHYSAAKAAVIGLTKALAKEVGLSGITVNCVAPGVIDTQMNSMLDEKTIEELKEETPLGVLGKAEDIANSILFLASDKAKFITGQVLSPNGGFVI